MVQDLVQDFNARFWYASSSLSSTKPDIKQLSKIKKNNFILPTKYKQFYQFTVESIRCHFVHCCVYCCRSQDHIMYFCMIFIKSALKQRISQVLLILGHFLSYLVFRKGFVTKRVWEPLYLRQSKNIGFVKVVCPIFNLERNKFTIWKDVKLCLYYCNY